MTSWTASRQASSSATRRSPRSRRAWTSRSTRSRARSSTPSATSTRKIGPILDDIGYTFDQIGSELHSFFTADTFEEIGGIIKGFVGATFTDVADVIEGTFGTAAKDFSSWVLTQFGDTQEIVNEIGSALEHAYSETATEVAGIFKSLNEDISYVEAMLSSVFSETVSEIGSVLSDFWSNDIIAGLGGAFKSFGSDLEDIGDTIASWF